MYGASGAVSLVFAWLILVYGIPGVFKAEKKLSRWFTIAYYLWAVVLSVGLVYWAFSNLYQLWIVS